jgi:hypothetical protein
MGACGRECPIEVREALALEHPDAGFSSLDDLKQ